MGFRHRVTATLAIVGALMLVGGPALAHDCTNVSKVVGAGSAGDGYFTAQITPDGEIYGFIEEFTGDANPAGQGMGGWFTTHFIAAVDGQEPVEIAVFDVLIHQDLGDAPRFGGPGEGNCDGVGIDDLDACLNPIIEEFLGSL
jgi:hypothetical protein